MLRIAFALSVFLLGFAFVGAQEEAAVAGPEPSVMHRWALFSGKIGDKAAIRAWLMVEPGEDSRGSLGGSYHYLSQRKAIHLSGSLDYEDNVELEERVGEYDDEVTGRFKGRWEENEGKPLRFTGSWSSGDGKRKLPFTLEEVSEPGSAKLAFYSFAESYERRRGDSSVQRERSLLFPQLLADDEASRRINAALRLLSLHRMDADSHNELDLSQPAPSLRALEKAVRAEIPTEEELDELEVSHFESLTFQDTFEVLLNERGLLCLRLFHTEYTGGAHGNHWAGHITFDLATGEELTLDDLLKPGARDELTRLAEASLREQHDLKPGASLAENGPLFEERFELNENWFLTPEGLGFSFDPYEIGPYAAGFIVPLIEFSRLKDLIKKDSKLEQLAGQEP